MTIADFTRRVLSRRRLMAGIGATAVAGTAFAGAAEKPSSHHHRAGHYADVELWLAKSQIAELRREYARATDLIGMDTETDVAAGRAIYHRVFSAKAQIGAAGQPTVEGPDAWVKVAHDALKVYDKTQHLIGTQIVDVTQMPGTDGEDDAGAATMLSYLQAWHSKADGELWLFIGAYHDKLAYTPGVGWQVTEMQLEQISGEERKMENPA